MNKDIQKHKDNLETNLKKLEGEMLEIAQKENDSTWSAIQTETNIDTADRVDVAESIDNYESNLLTTSSLEREVFDIKDALDKIESNTYGLCEICQKEIEPDRLNVEPQARTCELHMK
jgi:DnaK suppressor protein